MGGGRNPSLGLEKLENFLRKLGKNACAATFQKWECWRSYYSHPPAHPSISVRIQAIDVSITTPLSAAWAQGPLLSLARGASGTLSHRRWTCWHRDLAAFPWRVPGRWLRFAGEILLFEWRLAGLRKLS